MKFQTEAEREREVSGQFLATKDEIDLRQAGIVQSAADGAGRRRLVEAHVLLRIKFPH